MGTPCTTGHWALLGWAGHHCQQEGTFPTPRSEGMLWNIPQTELLLGLWCVKEVIMSQDFKRLLF